MAMQRQDDMAVMFNQLTDLTSLQRETIKARYRFLMAEYRRRAVLYSFLFYTLRILMTVGSLVVPALISLKSANDSNDDAMYWLTWTISLAVTTSNGLMTLFKLDKRFFMIHAVSERLRSETWQYLTLGGRYSGHYGGHRPNHHNQYVFFVSRLEKIRMKHVDEEYVRPAGEAGRDHHTGPQAIGADTSGSQEGENPVRDTIGGTNVPTPPDQAALVPSPPQQQQGQGSGNGRRESTSTVGDDANAETIEVQVHDEGRASLPQTSASR
jgi:hypothetical protein